MAGKIYTVMTALVVGMMVTFFTNTQTPGLRETELQTGIAKQILRFHVIANSDSQEDQALKMKVKNEVVAYIEELLKDSEGLSETKECLSSHLEQIEDKAEEIIEREGFSYPVRAAIEHTFFPRKTYGDLAFPAGEYEALRIQIGAAEGKNWWCVMYPSLCFVDSLHAVVPEEEKELLKNLLTEEEYQSILEIPPDKIHFKSGILEFWQKSCNLFRKQVK